MSEITQTSLPRARRSLSREVSDVLAERIVAGEFKPDSLLPPERELCETLGVSRTVVREAVKALENSGLVRIEHGRGTVVREANSTAVTASLKMLLRRRGDVAAHLTEVRRILEAGMVALAARRRTEKNLQRMADALQTMREKPDQVEGYVDADVEFHAEIARAAQNPLLLILLEPLSELLRESRIQSFSGAGVVRQRTRQHEERKFERATPPEPAKRWSVIWATPRAIWRHAARRRGSKPWRDSRGDSRR